MNNIVKKEKQKGFALLFTVIIVSAVSVITAGLTSAIYKQMVLSSLVKDSQTAFYQADTASDCALFADFVKVNEPDSTFLTTDINTPWSCGGLSLKKAGNEDSYTLSPDVDDDNSDPCFKIEIKRVGSITTMNSKGYNICDKTNPRTVEREIQIEYNQ